MSRNSALTVRQRVATGLALATAALLPVAAFATPGAEQNRAELGLGTPGGALVLRAASATGPTVYEGGFSGLHPVAGSTTDFWTVTDRGPNGQLSNSGKDRTYPVPGFAPEILRVHRDTSTTTPGPNGSTVIPLTITSRIPIRLSQANPLRSNPAIGSNPADNGALAANDVTGLPNTAGGGSTGVAAGDEPAFDVNDVALPYDPYGLDTEGVTVDTRDDSFWVVDEYRPSIDHIAADGTFLRRIIPSGESIGTFVPESAVLPQVYRDRQINRGFEGVAISPSGMHVYAVVQSPLGTACASSPITDPKKRVLTRIIDVDVSNPDAPALAHEWLYRMDTATGGAKQDDYRISDLEWVDSDHLLVDERDDSDGTAAHKTLYEVSLSSGTDLLSIGGAPVCVDAQNDAGLSSASINRLSKQLYFDPSGVNGWDISKLEGVALVSDGTIALTDDNDFQIVQSVAGTYDVDSTRPSQVRIYSLETAPLPSLPTFAVQGLFVGVVGLGILLASRRSRRRSLGVS